MVGKKLKVGDKLVDNDPRLDGRRVLTVVGLVPGVAQRVSAKDGSGRVRSYLRSRIHTDGEPHRSGLSLVQEP